MTAKETAISKLLIETDKPKELGGQQCGIPIRAVIVKSEELQIEIKVKAFKSNYRNRELANLLMELAIDEIIKQ